MRAIRILILISFILLALALFYFQIVRFGYYKGLSLKNAIRIIPAEACRGNIYDTNGEVLASSEISFDLVIVPQEAGDIQYVLGGLSSVTGVDKQLLYKNYKNNYSVPFAPVKVLTNLSRERAFSIEEKLSDIPASFIYVSPKRYYPNEKTASHILGYVGRIAKEEFKTLKDYGYKIKDMVGKSGVEKYYDAYLKGEDGGTQIEVDAKSREVRRLGFKEPKKGKDLKLTIDLGFQRFLDRLFEERNGACIVMDAQKGAVLGLVSSPEFNPNIFITGSTGQRQGLFNDAGHPLLNRAISASYPPGSIFKIIVASGGLEQKIIRPDSAFVCNKIYNLGRVEFNCWSETPHGPQNIIEGLTHSCNIFFFNLGRAIGADELHRYALLFGLSSITGIDLPQEIKGIVPGPLWKRFFLKERWYEGDTVNYSIGQGYVLVTPIQMLRAITLIANEGYCPTPYLADEIEGKKLAHKRDFYIHLKQNNYKVIKRGLCNVVNDLTGTGQRAKAEGISIAGKTGTAQAGAGKPTHAWFIGYMPADNPKISFVVFAEHGGQGGVVPAYIVKLMSTYLKENKFLNQ